MAFDTLIDRSKEEAERTAVADAIRLKTGTHAPLDWPDGFRTAIGGLGISDESASMDQVMDRTAAAVKAPSARMVPERFFFQSTKLKKVQIPNVTIIGKNAFSECSSLTDIQFPKVETIQSEAFYRSGLRGKYAFPEVRELGMEVFAKTQYTIDTLDFSKLEKTSRYPFSNTYARAIIIRTGKLCVAGGPVYLIPNTTYVYVPKALLETYLADTNWANAAPGQIRAIEDYPEITGG